MPEADVTAYLSRLGTFEALNAAINWYRAPRSGGQHARASGRSAGQGANDVLYGAMQDATVGRIAAEATAEFVTGPYRFEVVPGVGHFITDQAPERTTELLLQHVGAYSGIKRP